MLALGRAAGADVLRVVARLPQLLHRELGAALFIWRRVWVVGDEGVVLEAIRHVVREDPPRQIATMRLDQRTLIEDVIHCAAHVDVVERRDGDVHADRSEEVS